MATLKVCLMRPSVTSVQSIQSAAHSDFLDLGSSDVRIAYEFLFDGEEYQFQPVRSSGLIKYVGDVMSHGVHAELEAACDLLVRTTGDNSLNDLHLALGDLKLLRLPRFHG